ncbi:MAG: hypothetical protein LKG79_07080 [Furfurilactobacillus sp.]|uniref:Hypoxanthine-guanine phosphoribosyltransferase n=1 Tax=Furfurilactobacillus milii TaxID=2888272 RepID=A0ABT6DDI5_9LACO|nr:MULTISPECIES: phosphoribosyltransferase family protein [Furfurilactobacillus]MCF6160608.1 hypothetical protein [Furfurilactobacillus milii]MCF6162840.1 hypothetical protein [Furfurilactobacillus milii]MCF6420240.1 hypothetical protein [Furfurilactobacillus milii]MCH4010509.1 hypothetical protein [Furfurilactobacillus sp.]MCH4036401.1 hypothetical protein [Furfurilactobacillus sp.]
MNNESLKTLLDDHIGQIFATPDQIEVMVSAVAKQISEKNKATNPLLIGVMKGAAQWTIAVSQRLSIPSDLDFVSVTSYTGEQQSEPVMLQEPTISITGRHIILLDEIIDTGNTLFFLKRWLLAQGAKSVEIAVMADKPMTRVAPVHIDYLGLTVPNVWLVGFGMDLNGAYRNLPAIAEYVKNPVSKR